MHCILKKIKNIWSPDFPQCVCTCGAGLDRVDWTPALALASVPHSALVPAMLHSAQWAKKGGDKNVLYYSC